MLVLMIILVLVLVLHNTINNDIGISDTIISIHHNIINTIKHNILNMDTTIMCNDIDKLSITYIIITSNVVCLCYS